MSMPRATVGRYDKIHEAVAPGDHLPRQGKRGKADVVHAAVPDPNPTFKGARQRVAINRQTDVLENEYSRGRISHAAYAAGRVYQFALERAHPGATGQGQWNHGDRVDAVAIHDLIIMRRLEKAGEAVAMMDEARYVVGMTGERILTLILGKQTISGEPVTLAAAARYLSKRDDKYAVSFWAETFRRSLEGLVDHWGLKGIPG